MHGPDTGQRWLVIEPSFDGHHFVYLRRIVGGMLDAGIEPVVGVAADAQGERTTRGLQEAFGVRVQVVAIAERHTAGTSINPMAIALRELRHWRFLKRLFRTASRGGAFDRVLLPYLDRALFAISVLGSPFGNTPFAGITMRQRFHFPAMGVIASADRSAPLRERLFRRLLTRKGLHRVFAIDESLPEYLQRAGVRGAERVVFFPDPSDPPTGLDRADCRTSLGLPPEACVILLFGFLEPRKGLAALLEWAQAIPASIPAYVLAVGRQDEDAARILREPATKALIESGRVRLIDRFVTEAEADAMFSASDFVWLGYENFEMMSGVLVKAAQHERSIIYREVGLIARFAHRYGAPSEPSGSCRIARASLPAGLQTCRFGDQPIPDHSWAKALDTILK